MNNVHARSKQMERHFKGAKKKKKKQDLTNLSKPITGCRAPAASTSFFILGDECTRFPITPT